MIPLLTPLAYLWKAILDFFKGNKLAGILLIIVLALGLSQWNSCNRNTRLKKQLAVAEHNVAAANDTIRMVKDREGRIEFDKLAYLTDKVSNLEKINTELAADIKSIKGKVATIIKGEIQIKEIEKPVPFAVRTELADSTITSFFNYDTTYSPGNFRKLSGYTQYNLRNKLSGGSLTQSNFSMRFTTGIKNLDKGKPEIFLQSDYPGFTVTSLNGAVLDPNLFTKKKVPTITLGVGIGWVPVVYTLKDKKLDFNLQRFGVSAGVDINILKLLKRR